MLEAGNKGEEDTSNKGSSSGDTDSDVYSPYSHDYGDSQPPGGLLSPRLEAMPSDFSDGGMEDDQDAVNLQRLEREKVQLAVELADQTCKVALGLRTRAQLNA